MLLSFHLPGSRRAGDSCVRTAFWPSRAALIPRPCWKPFPASASRRSSKPLGFRAAVDTTNLDTHIDQFAADLHSPDLPPASDGADVPSARPQDDEPGLTWGDLNAEMNLTAAWLPREKKTPRADGDGDSRAPIVLGLLLAFLLSATAQVLRLFG